MDFGQQVCDHLTVGFGSKAISLLNQLIFQYLKVLDYSIVNQSELTFAT